MNKQSFRKQSSQEHPLIPTRERVDWVRMALVDTKVGVKY